DEIVIVDQSEDDATQRVVQAFGGFLDKLRYIRCSSRGLSNARNVGFEQTQGALVAFTDDDCVLRAGWAAQMKAHFADAPQLGAVFGRVVAVDHDARLGWIPVFEPAQSWTISARSDFPLVGLMGANMAFRRTALPAD